MHALARKAVKKKEKKEKRDKKAIVKNKIK